MVTFASAVAGGLIGKTWCEKAHAVSYIFTMFTFLLLGLVIFNLVFTYFRLLTGEVKFDNYTMIVLIITIAITIICQAIIILMHIPTHPVFFCRLFFDLPSYLVYQGAYSQTMVAHSFCNVDDVSWGTKGSTGSHGGKKY